jgi:hypothetical protein
MIAIAEAISAWVLEGANLSFAARAPEVRALLDAGGADKSPTVELVGTGGKHRARGE